MTIIATGSTASRTPEDRFADWVNVKDFGAVGGNAGDKAAFEAAIASVTGNTATVYVPRTASAYTIGSSVNVAGKNVSYIFEGGASVSSYDNLNGAIFRPQRLVRKTYGNRDAACGYTVRVNDSDVEAEILGITADSQLATYTDRDAVGMYVHSRGPAVLHTCTSCTYTATTVSFTNALNPNALKVGMYIDTAHSPKYTGKIVSWNAGGTQITVTGWYRVGNTASGQVPANGSNAYVNATTKVWAHNANVLLYSDSHATHACGFELGIIQNKAAYNESTDEPRTWGYDIVNLGTNRCSVGVIQRGDFRHGFESRNAYRAGYCVSTTGNPSYGFLAESGTNRFAALSSTGALSWSVTGDGNMTMTGKATAPDYATPVGGAHTFGYSATTHHAAGNVGSVGLTIDDGGNTSGVFVNNTRTGTLNSQDITFKTAEGGISLATERARISKNGDLLIGQNSTTVPGYGGNTTLGMALWGAHGRMFISQDDFSNWNMNADGAIVHFNRSGSSVGNISITTTSTAYNSASDYRLKQDVQLLTNAIDRLSLLKPSSFAFKAEPDRRFDGFIAHEVQEVCPQAVTGTKDGETMQAMDASKLIPLLTAALQEAVAKIAVLEAAVLGDTKQ